MRVLHEVGFGPARRVLMTAAVVLAGVGGTPSAASAAQDRTVECRCVDGAGDPVEECVCLTRPRLDGGYAALPFERRSVVGVSIDYLQGADADRVGAELQDVQSDGPADRAGLREGDLITHVGGHSVFDALERDRERMLDVEQSLPVQRFVQLVGALEPDESVEVSYLRDGRRGTATVTPMPADDLPFGFFGEFPRFGLLGDSLSTFEFHFDGGGDGEGFMLPREHLDGIQVFGTGEGGESFARRFRVDPCFDLSSGGEGQVSVRVLGMTNCFDGVEFVELNEGLGEYFGTDRGVLVAEVSEESSLGLRPGDVLMAIDGRAVVAVEDARRILRSYTADEELRLRVMRRGSETEILARMR